MAKEITIKLEYKDQFKTGIQKLTLSIPENKITPHCLIVTYCSAYGQDKGHSANLYHEKIFQFYEKMQALLPPEATKLLRSTYSQLIEYYQKDTTPIITDEQIKNINSYYKKIMQKSLADAKREDKVLVFLAGESHDSQQEQLYKQIIFENFRELGGKALGVEIPNYYPSYRGFYTTSAMLTLVSLCSGYGDMWLSPIDQAIAALEMSKLTEDFSEIPYSPDNKDQYDDSIKRFITLMTIRDQHMANRIIQMAITQKKQGTPLILASCGRAHLPGIIKYLKLQKDISIEIIGFFTNNSYKLPYMNGDTDLPTLLRQITVENYSASMPELIEAPTLDSCKVPVFYNNLQLHEKILHATHRSRPLPLCYFSAELIVALIEDHKEQNRDQADCLTKDKMALLNQMLTLEIDQKSSPFIQHMQATEFFESVCIAISRKGRPENPLLWAVRKGRHSLLKHLLKSEALDVNLTEENTQATALSEAQKLGYKEMAKDLIEAGAKPSSAEEKLQETGKLSGAKTSLFSTSPVTKKSPKPLTSITESKKKNSRCKIL